MIDFSNNPFDRRGNLRTSCTFRFIGEIRLVSIRQMSIWRQAQDSEDTPLTAYAISMIDDYGFLMSYWDRGQDRERAIGRMKRIPIGETIVIEGNVVVRKGTTYFNAKTFLWPDETPISLLPDVTAVEEGEAS